MFPLYTRCTLPVVRLNFFLRRNRKAICFVSDLKTFFVAKVILSFQVKKVFPEKSPACIFEFEMATFHNVDHAPIFFQSKRNMPSYEHPNARICYRLFFWPSCFAALFFPKKFIPSVEACLPNLNLLNIFL